MVLLVLKWRVPNSCRSLLLLQSTLQFRQPSLPQLPLAESPLLLLFLLRPLFLPLPLLPLPLLPLLPLPLLLIQCLLLPLFLFFMPVPLFQNAPPASAPVQSAPAPAPVSSQPRYAPAPAPPVSAPTPAPAPAPVFAPAPAPVFAPQHAAPASAPVQHTTAPAQAPVQRSAPASAPVQFSSAPAPAPASGPTQGVFGVYQSDPQKSHISINSSSPQVQSQARNPVPSFASFLNDNLGQGSVVSSNRTRTPPLQSPNGTAVGAPVYGAAQRPNTKQIVLCNQMRQAEGTLVLSRFDTIQNAVVPNFESRNHFLEWAKFLFSYKFNHTSNYGVVLDPRSGGTKLDTASFVCPLRPEYARAKTWFVYDFIGPAVAPGPSAFPAASGTARSVVEQMSKRIEFLENRVKQYNNIAQATAANSNAKNLEFLEQLNQPQLNRQNNSVQQRLSHIGSEFNRMNEEMDHRPDNGVSKRSSEFPVEKDGPKRLKEDHSMDIFFECENGVVPPTIAMLVKRLKKMPSVRCVGRDVHARFDVVDGKCVLLAGSKEKWAFSFDEDDDDDDDNDDADDAAEETVSDVDNPTKEPLSAPVGPIDKNPAEESLSAPPVGAIDGPLRETLEAPAVAVDSFSLKPLDVASTNGNVTGEHHEAPSVLADHISKVLATSKSVESCADPPAERSEPEGSHAGTLSAESQGPVRVATVESVRDSGLVAGDPSPTPHRLNLDVSPASSHKSRDSCGASERVDEAAMVSSPVSPLSPISDCATALSPVCHVQVPVPPVSCVRPPPTPPTPPTPSLTSPVLSANNTSKQSNKQKKVKVEEVTREVDRTSDPIFIDLTEDNEPTDSHRRRAAASKALDQTRAHLQFEEDARASAREVARHEAKIAAEKKQFDILRVEAERGTRDAARQNSVTAKRKSEASSKSSQKIVVGSRSLQPSSDDGDHASKGGSHTTSSRERAIMMRELRDKQKSHGASSISASTSGVSKPKKKKKKCDVVVKTVTKKVLKPVHK